MLGGIRSGKSFCGALWAATRPPRTTTIVAAPTYKVMQGGSMASLLPILEGANVITAYNKQDGRMELTDGKVLYFRSMERAQNTRGITANFIWFDEPGMVGTREASDVLIGRMSADPAQALYTTTPPPEGKRSWLYDMFVARADSELHEVVKCRTKDNLTLREDYEPEMRREYLEAYALRELDAEWIDVGAVDVYDVGKLLTRQLPAPDIVRTARAWDTAATGGGGDYTAGVLLSIHTDNSLSWRDVVRGQWTPEERDEMMRRTAESDGRGVQIYVAQERGSAGKSQARYWTRQLAGFSVKAELESGDKVVRAGPLAALIGNGDVTLTCEPGRWENYYHEGKRLTPEAARAQLRANLSNFPAIRTKDESDAGALGLDALTRRDSGISVGRSRG